MSSNLATWASSCDAQLVSEAISVLYAKVAELEKDHAIQENIIKRCRESDSRSAKEIASLRRMAGKVDECVNSASAALAAQLEAENGAHELQCKLEAMMRELELLKAKARVGNSKANH